MSEISESIQLKEIAEEVDKIVAKGDAQPTEASPSVDDTPTTAADALAALESIDLKSLSDVQLVQFLQHKEYLRQKQRYDRAQSKAKMVDKEHKFWNTQPVLPLSEDVVGCNGPIDDKTTVDQVRKEPLNMPAGFEWCSIDIFDPVQAAELYKLLNENYVEDDDCMFRFDYSVDFLQWALSPPGYLQEWHVGVRNAKTKVLMGCITAIPVEVRVYDKVESMAEINFLCVHKKLRTKRLAPVLIKEITRRVNLTNRWQAVYTAGVVLPKPVGRCRYYHRSLNPKKLIEVRFSSLPPRTTLANHIKSLKLPTRPVHALRQMTIEDVPQVQQVLQAYLSKKAKLAQEFSEADVAHILLPRKEVVSTYVLEGSDGKITDICSFYYLPSTVIGNPLHNKLNAVYSYYNVANSISLEDLMKDLLVLARNEGADVFNALDLMDNESVFPNLQFGAGDGWLQYYVYNWKCPTMNAEDVGIVLL